MQFCSLNQNQQGGQYDRNGGSASPKYPFDALNNIYLMRKIALDDLIKQKLIDEEAKKRQISKDSFLNYYYALNTDSISLLSYAKRNRVESEISEFKSRLFVYKTKSTKGQEILLDHYRNFILNQLIDSLKKIHRIESFLKEPIRPPIKIENLLVHYKGNLSSKVSFVVISDFECDMCHEFNPIFDSIFSRYKNRIRFGFANYGSYVSLSALAAECADNQGKFWAFHDSIFKAKNISLDSTSIYKIAISLNLNLAKFTNDLNAVSLSKRIEKSLHSIRAAGIYGTPTILINDKILFNSSSIKEIKKTLDDELNNNSQ